MLASQLHRAGVIAYLVFECLSLSEDLAVDLERNHNFSRSDFLRYHVRSIPTQLGNIVLSHACADRFGPEILLATGMFYKFSRRGPCDCLEWTSECCCDLETWRLDVNPNLAPRGLLLPTCDKRYGFFDGLLVFRHVRDQKPFRLQLRSEVAA